MNVAKINPTCCICGESIGEMTIDIYLAAIGYRGEYLFCPNCRTHKCDCCGIFNGNQTTRKVYHGTNGNFLGRACETCFQFVVSYSPTEADFPSFFQFARPNLIYTTWATPAPESEARWDER